MSRKGRVYEKSGGLVAGTALGGSENVTLAPEWFAEGYRRALERFRAAWSAENQPREWFFPLFEALNWSVAYTDNLKKTVGKPLNDPVVLGLRFARNTVHHQWAQALELRKLGIQVTKPSGNVWPPVASDWFWKPVTRLPTDEKHTNGMKEYTDRLADRQAHEALDHLEKLLGTD